MRFDLRPAEYVARGCTILYTWKIIDVDTAAHGICIVIVFFDPIVTPCNRSSTITALPQWFPKMAMPSPMSRVTFVTIIDATVINRLRAILSPGLDKSEIYG